jgi:hypothetical protein
MCPLQVPGALTGQYVATNSRFAMPGKYSCVDSAHGHRSCVLMDLRGSVMCADGPTWLGHEY